MLTKADLEAPAHLAYVTQGQKIDTANTNWSGGEEIATLREALHRAVTEDPPPGRHAVIRAKSGPQMSISASRNGSRQGKREVPEDGITDS